MISKTRFLLLVFTVVVAFTWNTESALAACNPDPPMDGDAVVCDGVDSDGYDGSGATDLTVTTLGNAVLDEGDGVLDSAILVGDDNSVTIGVDATVNVTEANGFGIRGNDGNTIINEGTINVEAAADGGIAIRANNDNFVNNRGMIVLNGMDARGISINQNTTGILPNGGVNTGTIIVNGLRGFAIETGDNSGVTSNRTITLNANESRGISAGNRTDPLLPSNLSNSGFGLIRVEGNNSFGIKAGDGWITGELVGESGVSQAGVFTEQNSRIIVSGNDSFGIFTGDALNMVGNNNSFVLNIGTITVSGTDSTAVSLGGQDLLDPFDSQGTATLDIASFENFGTITGNQDSNPLVEFRSFVVGRENSVANAPSGVIRADPADFGMPGRGIAIRGTAGSEFIFNLGEIEGVIDLMGGDDTYVHGPRATLTDSATERTVRGGPGNDLATLTDNSFEVRSFDVDVLVDFETLEIGGGSFGWELTNTTNFTGLTEIAPFGRLSVPTPIILGGDFLASPTGTLELTLDGTNPALTILGTTATFDGTLSARADLTVMPGATMLPAIATSGYTGQFQFNQISGNQVLAVFYGATDVSVQLVSRNSVGVARGSSERAIAQHLDDIAAVGSPSPHLQTLLDEFDTATGTLNNVFSALSPEIYDAQTTVIVDGGRRVSTLLFDRPRECQPGEHVPWQGPEAKLACHGRRWSPWLAAIGGTRSREEFGGHSRYDAQMGGLVVGVDVSPMEGLDLTLAVSSQRGTLDGASNGKSTITLTDLTGHAAWTRGPLRLQGTMGWGHGFLQDKRRIRFSEDGITTVDRRGTAEHDSDRISIAGEVGYVFDVGPVKIEPVGGFDWAWVYQRPIHEDETFGFGVRVDSRDDSIGSINAGVRVTGSYLHSKYLGQQLLWMDGVWKPSVQIRWRQMLAGYERDLEARLQGSPDGVSKFKIEGKEDSGGVEIGAGMSFTPQNANRLQLDLRYEAFISEHAVAHDLIAQVMINF